MSKILEIIVVIIYFQCSDVTNGFVFFPEIEYKKDTHFSFKPAHKPFEILKGFFFFPFMKIGENHVPVPEKHKRSVDMPFTFYGRDNNIQLLSKNVKLRSLLRNGNTRQKRESLPIPGPPDPIDVIKPPTFNPVPPAELGVLPPTVVNIPVNPAITYMPGFLMPEQSINKFPISPLFTDITGRIPFLSTTPPLNVPPPNLPPPIAIPPIVNNNIENEKPKEEKAPVPVEQSVTNPLARGSRLAMYFGSVLLDMMSQLITNARSAFIQFSESPPKI